MTQDEIIAMAREASFKMENSAAIQAAETFAKLIAAKALAQRTWVGLTDDEIKTICSENGWDSSWQSLRFARAIEAKLKQKNGYAEEKNT